MQIEQKISRQCPAEVHRKLKIHTVACLVRAAAGNYTGSKWRQAILGSVNCTFGEGRFCVQLCIETLCKRAISVAHLTNFSFELFYEIFTEDAPPPLLYHGAKKSKMTKNSNQRGSCLKFLQTQVAHNLMGPHSNKSRGLNTTAQCCLCEAKSHRFSHAKIFVYVLKPFL